MAADALEVPFTSLLPPPPMAPSDGPTVTLREQLVAMGYDEATIEALGARLTLDGPAGMIACTMPPELIEDEDW